MWANKSRKVVIMASLLWLSAPSSSASSVVACVECDNISAVPRTCKSGCHGLVKDPALRCPINLRGGRGDTDRAHGGSSLGRDFNFVGAQDRVNSALCPPLPSRLRGGDAGSEGGAGVVAGSGTEEPGQGLQSTEQGTQQANANETKAPCNTEGGCPHGRHSDNPDEQHCMECEVMAFLQRAANLLQQAGGRIESTVFAEQWTELYPEDPLTPEQVTTAVAGILKESGYFHVEETSDPAVKMFELIEQGDDGGGIGRCQCCRLASFRTRTYTHTHTSTHDHVRCH